MDETNTSIYKCIGTHEWHDIEENVHKNDWCHLFNDDTDTKDEES